ncbi:DUF6682 family protein [Ciceribacter sp. L1K22]|uniref:phage adaptor protein n=1 Tax=Ciceribacter sp. L1K22 TaxID=2820275 RepID=UPI001ABE0A91|nr:DUF6682 family protein [Ciceribacter sp. L1K22]MBO3760344.1 hypothetical protein [Ciceribacter sp. L1K22]
MLASNVMTKAGVQLLDEDHVRWTLPDLATYITEAVSAIISVKPSARTVSVTVDLVAGTRQQLPDDQRIVQLIDIPCNMSAGVRGRSIRSVARAELDSNEPRWHEATVVPFRKEVRNFMFDEITPTLFWVYPGNDGTGAVEAFVSQLPPPVETLVEEDDNTSEIETWEVSVGLADHYEPAVLEYVLYRCFSKEELAGSGQKAVAHYQAFATLIGLKSQVERDNSPRRS